MTPHDPRAKPRPAARPLPPVRTLRGEAELRSAPLSAWIPPVRSGLVTEPVPPTRPSLDTPGDVFANLEVLPELPLEPLAPAAEWVTGTEPPEAVVEPEAEIVLEDEAYWIDEPEAIVEALGHGETVMPVEGLTPVGDLTGDAEQAVPVIEALDLDVEPWAESEFVEFEEEPTPGPDAGARAAGEAAAGPDTAELANRLERLADQLRMHGRDALADAESRGDRIEAALAAALAGLLQRSED